MTTTKQDFPFTQSYWMLNQSFETSSALSGSHKTDVVIVRGGCAGLSTAFTLKEAQPDLKPLGIPAFIPAGMVAQTEEDSPTAHALMVGRVLESEAVTNQLTGRDFVRLRLETPAGPMDMAVDPGLVEALPQTGHIIQAGAWLSGRLARENDEK